LKRARYRGSSSGETILLRSTKRIKLHSMLNNFLLALLFLIILAAIVGLLALITGANPLNVLYWILWGGFSPQQIPETLLRASPILIIASGLAIPYMAKVWNIGSEGQLIFGAIGTAWIGIHLSGWGSFGILIAVLFGGLCGLVWALIPGLLRVYRGSNEVLTTLMMNYIAIYMASYLLNGPLKSKASLFPETDLVGRDLWLDPLFPGTRIHAGILISLALLPLAIHILFGRSLIGLRLRIIGAGEVQARYFKLNSGLIVILSMIFSGFMAGVAGSLEVLGVHHRALPTISQGYGYLAIPVAMVSGPSAPMLLIASIGLGGVTNGVTVAQMITGIPSGMMYILQGFLLIMALIIIKIRG